MTSKTNKSRVLFTFPCVRRLWDYVNAMNYRPWNVNFWYFSWELTYLLCLSYLGKYIADEHKYHLFGLWACDMRYCMVLSTYSRKFKKLSDYIKEIILFKRNSSACMDCYSDDVRGGFIWKVTNKTNKRYYYYFSLLQVSYIPGHILFKNMLFFIF